MVAVTITCRLVSKYYLGLFLAHFRAFALSRRRPSGDENREQQPAGDRGVTV